MEFYVEMTDTFAGEANYSWVRRFLVKANTERGAINKVVRETMVHAKKVFGSAGLDCARYDGVGHCACYFVMLAEGNEREKFHHIVIL